MQPRLFVKLFIIFGLTVLIGITLAMVHGTIEERAEFRKQAVNSIASESVREQTVSGPLLVIRYTDEFDEEVLVAEGANSVKKTVPRSVKRQFIVFPQDLDVKSNLTTDRRYRGIHQVLVYSGRHQLAGDFMLPKLADLPRANPTSRLTLANARVVLGIADVRGIRNISKIGWNKRPVEFQQGTGLKSIPAGLQADLGVLPLEQPEGVVFGLTLDLDGIEQQNFVPIGKNNKFSVKSDWPHPQFGGDFLPSPRERTINAAGFSANWQISSLSTMAQKQISDREAGTVDPRQAPGRDILPDDARPPAIDTFGVGFIEPVNVYTLAERATKYGLLFVVLTFAAFFLFEMIKNLPIHPIQYLLVGLALVLFFLLLVSMSEHMRFGVAYMIASVACIALIGFYLSHVLRDWRRGFAFGAALTALYGALYGLLISENNALVLGSLLLFAVLAGFMIATRKIDWYNLTAPAPEPEQPAQVA